MHQKHQGSFNTTTSEGLAFRVWGYRCLGYSEGPSTQKLGTLALGDSNYSIGLGKVHDYLVLGPFGTWTLRVKLQGYEGLGGKIWVVGLGIILKGFVNKGP